jgi:hypothetical protein
MSQQLIQTDINISNLENLNTEKLSWKIVIHKATSNREKINSSIREKALITKLNTINTEIIIEYYRCCYYQLDFDQ